MREPPPAMPIPLGRALAMLAQCATVKATEKSGVCHSWACPTVAGPAHGRTSRPCHTSIPLVRALAMLALCASAFAADMAVAPAPKDSGSGLLFHVSFDSDRSAEVAPGPALPVMARYRNQNRTAGGGALVKGVFGKALTGRCGRSGSGHYDALGAFLPERGTIAFFVRQSGLHYGFEPFRINTVDPYYWRMYVRLSNKSNRLSAWFADETYKPVVLHAGRGCSLKDSRWRHIAVVWDQAFGAKYYFDGKEVASNWGKVSWTSRGVDPDKISLHYDNGVSYDELYIFDRPLTAAQIRRLFRANTAPRPDEPAPTPFDEPRQRNRLRELSWERPDPAMARLRLNVEGLGVNAVRQIVPLDARGVKKYCGEAFDGKLGAGWPPLYGYRYAKGNGLHVNVGEPCDLAVIEGRFSGDVYGRRVLLPRGKPIARIRSRSFKRRLAFASPRAPGWLSFFRTETANNGHVRGGRICELSFFRRNSHQLQGARVKRLYLGTAAVAPAVRALGRELTGRFAPGDRAALALSGSPPSRPGGQSVPGLRFHHLIVPGADSDTPLRGLRFVWRVRGDLAGNALYVEMRDPALPGRRLFASDFALTGARGAGPHTLDLTLDTADRLLPRNKSLWLIFCFKKNVDILWTGERPSAVELLVGKREEVLPEYLRTELAFAKSRFRELSESRPWHRCQAPEKELTPFNRYARELFQPLVRLRELMPDDPKVRAIWLWTHKFVRDTRPVVPVPAPGAPDAPHWALLQRELLARCRDTLYWWIENRQTPNGEFGDAWGDDTDFIQNFPKIALLGDPGGKLARAARLVADGVYRDRLIERGINRRVTDTLHAYEEGVNAQPVMALMDYGAPKYLERMMEAAHTVAHELTAIDHAGRRRFRSGHFGAEGVRDKGRYGADHPGNALFCHPALFLCYYSRLPAARKFLQEWADGWLDIYKKKRRPGDTPYPKATLLNGSVVAWDSKIRGYGYVDLYVALHALTGERRYADVSRFWTGARGPGGGFMRGAHCYLPALELIDRDRWRKQLIRWADQADLSRPGDDSLGRAARERYMKWEMTGDEKAAIEALEACVRKMRLTFEAHTWAEPINDRIWLPDHPIIMMTQGEMSHERNQLWPRHYVSYEGFSDFAAWVREKSQERIRVWIYSFAATEEAGKVRVWRSPHAEYRVVFGPDADRDGLPDRASPMGLKLHRAAAIPLRLPPRRLCALDVRLMKLAKDDFWSRPDLALSTYGLGDKCGDKLCVVLHNLGAGVARNVVVRVTDAKGAELARRRVREIEAPLDLKPRRRQILFTGLPLSGDLVVTADPGNAISEINEDNNVLRLRRRP